MRKASKLTMKYAVVNGERQEAKPGLSGTCACCGNKVIAKCGKLRSWHWAHCGKRMCDPWWEESEWHRAWKGLFPQEWQEIIHYAPNGEKHIADVKTDQGCVIELQHSKIKPEERKAREDFYKNMIWIVDGTRRLSDKNKFNEVLKDSKLINTNLLRLGPFFDECALLRDWTGGNIPIFFDFEEDFLWGLLPKNKDGNVYVYRIEKSILLSALRPEAGGNTFKVLFQDVLLKILNEERNMKTKKDQTVQAYQVRPPLHPRNMFYTRRRRRL